MKPFKFYLLLSIILSSSCTAPPLATQKAENIYLQLKNKFAPDKRVELFDISFKNTKNKLILKGETTSKEGFSILLDSLKNTFQIVNRIRVLPDSAVGKQQFAVANNAVINIRSQPKHSAELGTQGLLGMSLKIIDKKGDFYRVQTPDHYISWVDKGGITKMNASQIDQWKQAKKIIFTKNFGFVYANASTNSEIISDISLGGLLVYLSEDTSFFKVKYPDNRIGFIKKEESSHYNSWLEGLKNTEDNIEITAKSMIGFPYLWGGTSSKGVDCSGFTKMVYLMNGAVIPRDASQQINAGEIADKDLVFEGLRKGDLLFFGKKATAQKKQKVTHVGIWLGNHKKEFIHASGNVHLSSMDTMQLNYDEFNKNRYLGARRYLNIKDKNIMYLKDTSFKR